MIKIMLVDEHRLVIEGIKQLLETYPEFEIIAISQDGITALNQLKKQLPDIVLTELHLPRMGGIEMCKIIARNYRQVKVIILTSWEADIYANEAFRAGAKSYLSKTITPQELVAAIHTVYEAGVLIPSHIAHHILRTATHKVTSEAEPLYHLTPKEREILSLVVEGRSTSDIASFFFISPKTIRNHLSHIYEKLGTKDRLQTVLYLKQLYSTSSPKSSVSAM
jgi:DNA-binding NarL/FixJ family response regulator